MRALFMLCSFLLCTDMVLALQISEVMYNPQGDDDVREFIELFAETLPDLSRFSVADSASNDSLVLLRSGSSTYALIVEDGADLTALGVSPDATIYTIGAAIGNSLGNTQDAISLFDAQGTLIDHLQYNGTLANGNGKSLVRVDGVWQESAEMGGSPGRTNVPTSPLLLNTNVTPTPCNGAFNFTADKSLYQSGEQVRMQFTLSDEDSPFLITYWADDLRGAVVRNPRNTTNANAKTFTARSEGADQVLLLRAQYQQYCNLSRIVESHVQVVIMGEGVPAQNSTLVFRDLPPTAAFGDTLVFELEVYRANTRKSVVEVYVADRDGKKVSKTAKFTVTEQFTHTIAAVELSLYSSCSGKFKPGAYQLIAKGIDTVAVQSLALTAMVCDSAAATANTPDTKDTQAEADASVHRNAALELSFTDFPAEAEVGSAHTAGVALTNPSSEPRTINVWSYAYRGSASLSGDRERNLQTVEIPAGTTQQLSLEIILDGGVDAGTASYKVKVIEEGRKTPIEMRQNLTLIGHASVPLPLRAAPSSPVPNLAPIRTEITGNAVYRSKQADIKRLSIYFLLGACLITISLLVWRGK